MIKPQTWEPLEYGFIRFCILMVSLAFAFISSDFVRHIIKPSNPYNILNLHTASGFSPEQNFARIIWIIFFSLVAYKLLTYALAKNTLAFRVIVALVVIFNVLAVDILPRIASYKGNLDMFHNGEQLSPANDFNAGKGLYSDMFVLHGAGEDVIVPSIALRLAEKGNKNTGIASYYFFTSLLQLVSAALFIVLLALLFKNTALFLATSLWFTVGAYSFGPELSFDYARDIFTWSLCVLILYALFRPDLKYKKAVYVSAGILSSLALFYALDRGVIALFIVGLLAVISVFFKPLKAGGFAFRLPKKIKDFQGAALITAGIVITQLVVAMLLGFGQYKDFITTYFVDIPKYQGLLFNFPLPPFNEANFLVWLPILLTPLAVLMLYRLVTDSVRAKKFTPAVLLSCILVATGLLFLRAGYGRSDVVHIAYSTPLLLVGIFYTCLVYTTKYYNSKNLLWLPATAILLLFIPLSTVRINDVATVTNVTPGQLKAYVTLPAQPDEKWLSPEAKQVSSYIKNHTSSSDPIFVFIQQPMYYYLTDRRNPTRFYVPWFADPKPFEKELLNSLKKDQPKYIIYLSDSPYDNFDGYYMKDRTPSVNAWILQNYPNSKKIGHTTVLSQ